MNTDTKREWRSNEVVRKFFLGSNIYKFIVDILDNQANIGLRSEGFEQWKLYNTLMLGLLGNLEDADKEDILQRAYKKAGRDENSIMLDYAEKYKGATPLSRED